MSKRETRNLKKLLTITCLLLFATISHAQNKEHTVVLNQNIVPVETNFVCSEVIDKRLIKDNIGFAQKGLGNRKVIAKLDGDIEEVIKNNANKIILEDEKPDNIIFIIHELTVSERTTAMSERGMCIMEIEFVKRVDSTYYSLGTFSDEIEEGGMDVTKKHGKRISKCLKNCIIDFTESDWMNNRLKEEIDIEEEIFYAYDYKVIPPKGMYSSFAKMGKGEPMEEFEKTFQRIRESGYIQQYFLKAVDRENKNKKVMFVSDGEGVYMHASRYCYQNHFIKARHIGKYIYFEDQFSNANATVAFGLLGAAMSNKKRAIILDTTNGEVSLLTEAKLYAIAEGQKEIIQEYKKSKKKMKNREIALMKLNKKYEE